MPSYPSTLLSLLLLPHAAAGVWVEDLDAESVVLVVEDREGEHLGLCADDGQGADGTAGDAVWSCGDLPVGGEVRLGLMVDGARLAVSPRGQVPEGDLTLGLVEDTLRLSEGEPDAGVAGAPRPPRHAVLIEIDAGPLSQAPVVQLRGDREVQLPCRDNGDFPDRVQNDDIATCGGVAPGTDLQVQIRSHTGQVDLAVAFDASDSVLMARYSDGALQPTKWAALPAELDLSGAAPQEVPEPGVLPTPDAQGAPQGAPQGQPPRGAPWWSLLLAALTLAGGIWLGRRMRGGLPGALEWAHAPDGSSLERVEGGLAELVLQRSHHGPVVVLAPSDAELPEGEPGPVLRATSPDVLDIAEALATLRRQHGLRSLSLVVADAALLTSPGEVGLDPLERLRGELPPGTRAFVL